MSNKKNINFQPKTALISVSDKRQLGQLAKTLHKHGVQILATGNTASQIKKSNIPVTDISEYTGFEEMMDGRVKTLHPAVHAGILARGEQDADALTKKSFLKIDLVIVNLYPFEQVISDPTCDFQKAIENIDIGGPTMVRAAAKNHAHCYIVVAPEDYSQLEKYLATQTVPADWAFSLAKKAFAHTAAYDAAISNYLGTLDAHYKPSSFPAILTQQYVQKGRQLRYGENPHQQAIFYTDKKPRPGSLAAATLLQGKALSYNNLLDADAAYNCVKSFDASSPCCVIVKHTNPCGIAIGENLLQAYQRAFHADPQSAFGGIIAFNQTVDAALASTILKQQFVEVIIAPKIEKAARDLFKQKENIRLLETGILPQIRQNALDLRQIDGGLLVQEHDSTEVGLEDFDIVSEMQATREQLQDMLFAWKAVKHVKSNAIVYARNQATIGIGAGQSSRVMSAKIGLMMAENYGFPTLGAVMASDAFLPFPDTVEIAADAGISAIIQPGGSVRDQQVIDCANKNQIAMIFTSIRHFKH